jgi:hypothetical protein
MSPQIQPDAGKFCLCAIPSGGVKFWYVLRVTAALNQPTVVSNV